MSKKFAVFDIDGTIARTSLFFQIVDELISGGHLPMDYREQLDEKYKAYQHRQHTNAFKEYTDFIVTVLLQNLTQISVADYRNAVDAVIERSNNMVYVYTRDLITKLKNEGYFLMALSSSEQYAVEKFSEHFGFDLAVGEIYHQENGRFSGKFDGTHGKKDEVLQKHVASHSLSFEDSYAVGDSLSDAAMLRLVTHPIAFNPEDSLFEEAKKHGWTIVVERKNVIYRLESNSDGSYVLA